MKGRIFMNYENLGYSLNKYLACLALSLITVFSFGIDIISHQIYNLSEFFYLKNGIVTRTDFIVLIIVL